MVHIKKDSMGYPIGWELLPTTDEERAIAATIRDLQFLGFNDTAIVYNGMSKIDPEGPKIESNLKSVSWIQKKHSSFN
jgi:hypothetical protein